MKPILFLILLSLSLPAFAPDEKVIYVEEPEAVNLYEAIISAVIEVESSGDSLAFNPVEQAYGIMQIRPIRLLDYNQRTGKNYKMRDCFKVSVSREIFLYYVTKHRPDDLLAICREWNGASEKNKYYQKVKAKL